MYIHELASALYLMFSVSFSPPFNNLLSSCPLPAFILQLYIPLQIYSFDVFEGEQKIPFAMQVSVQPVSESVNTLGPVTV